MLIWLTLLPFGLHATCGWATIPISCLISVLLLAIDEIAIEIEEPFG
jgi:ion channel-forming bestrophin family protein